MTDPVVPAVAPKPVAPVVPAPTPVVAAKAPEPKPEEKADTKPDAKEDPAVATGEPHPEPKPNKTPAARLDALEARLAYLTALMGWPTEEHDERLAEKAKAEQVDFAGNPVKAA